jgi:hypothetical protein
MNATLLYAGAQAGVGRRLNHLVPPEGSDGMTARRRHVRARMAIKRSLVVAFCVPLALTSTAGCTSDKNPTDDEAAAAPLHVAGAVDLIGRHVDFYPQSSGNECVGKGALADVTGGAEVRITDGSGQTLAVTRLGMGIADTSTTDLAAGFCDFLFDASVPRGKGSYTIQVGRHNDQTFSEKQMATPKLYLG